MTLLDPGIKIIPKADSLLVYKHGYWNALTAIQFPSLLQHLSVERGLIPHHSQLPLPPEFPIRVARELCSIWISFSFPERAFT